MSIFGKACPVLHWLMEDCTESCASDCFRTGPSLCTHRLQTCLLLTLSQHTYSFPASSSPAGFRHEASVVVMDKACAEFHTGADTFQTLLFTVQQSVQTAQEDLKAEKKRLAEEREALEQEKVRVAEVSEAFNDQITLNVGGALYTTTRTTLKNAPLPSLFSAMFSGRHILKPDEKGHYFIDRDSRHFHDILNFLRDGTFNYPANSTDWRYLLELRAEAEYFGLIKLTEAIDAYPYGLTTIRRATTLATEEGWCYEEGKDEIVLTVDQSVQLLGIGFCGTDGSYTATVDISEVDEADYTTSTRHLRDTASTFVKTEKDVVPLMLRPPLLLTAAKHYKISALIKGSDSYCSEDCLEMVVADGVKMQFCTYESPNGTCEDRGQFPELYIRALPSKGLG